MEDRMASKVQHKQVDPLGATRTSWFPSLQPTHLPQVHAIEQHRELRPVQHQMTLPLGGYRRHKSTLLQALVEQSQPTAIPPQDLRPVSAVREEHEEIAVVERQPARLHQPGKAVESSAQIHRTGGHPHPGGARLGQQTPSSSLRTVTVRSRGGYLFAAQVGSLGAVYLHGGQDGI
jgi:hypothetical protein